jgi:hypothetical protein
VTTLRPPTAAPLIRQLVEVGFACAEAEPGLAECTFVRSDRKSRYVTRLLGPDKSRVVAVTTILAIDVGTISGSVATLLTLWE